jgi:hypothetical protein
VFRQQHFFGDFPPRYSPSISCLDSFHAGLFCHGFEHIVVRENQIAAVRLDQTGDGASEPANGGAGTSETTGGSASQHLAVVRVNQLEMVLNQLV